MLNLTYMKKIILYALFFFIIFQAKSIEMEPGLWKIQTTIEIEGKQIDPQAEYKKMMSAVPSDKRKKIEEALQKSLKKQQISLNKDGTSKVCYSKKSLQNPLTLIPENKGCKVTILKNTQSKLQSSFNCKGNASGTIEWNMVDRKKFNGIVLNKNSLGISKTIQTGKFMSPNCGTQKVSASR